MSDETQLHAYLRARGEPAAGDWSDVLTRVRRQRRTAATRAILLAAVTAAALVVAMPALGLGGIVSFIGDDSKPFTASDSAQFRLLTSSRPALAPDGDVTANATTSFEGSTWSVTSYKNERGETCVGERIDGGQGLGCSTAAEMFAHGPVLFTSGGRQNNGTDDKSRWDVGWVWGVAAPDVSSVTLLSTDCSSRTVTLGTGRIFLYLANRSALYSGAWPYKLVAKDGAGHAIHVAAVNFAPPMPSSPEKLASVPVPEPSRGCSP